MFTSILGHGNRITKAGRLLRTQLGVEDLEGRVVPSTMMAELNQAGPIGIGWPRIGEEIPTVTSQQATVTGHEAGVYGRGSTEEIPQILNGAGDSNSLARATAVVFGAIHDIGEEIPSLSGRQATINHIGEEIPQTGSPAAAPVPGDEAGVYGRGSTEEIPQIFSTAVHGGEEIPW